MQKSGCKMLLRFYLLLLFFCLILQSCAHQDSLKSSNQTNKPNDIDNVILFPSEQEARNYFLQQRLNIQRLYELTSEPYFGTSKEKDCRANIDIKADILMIRGGEYFQVRVLVNSYYALGDCLNENNNQNAIYQYVLCHKEVGILKLYYPLDHEQPFLSKPKCYNP